MKKILCLLSSAVMFVSLVACGSFTSSSKQQNIDVMTNAHYFATVIKSSTLLNHCYIVAGEVLDAYSEKWDGTNVYDEKYLNIGGTVVEKSSQNLTIEIESYLYGSKSSWNADVTPILVSSIDHFEIGDTIWVIGKFDMGGRERNLAFTDAVIFTSEEYAQLTCQKHDSYEKCAGKEVVSIDAYDFFYGDMHDNESYPGETTRVKISGLYVGHVQHDSASLWYEKDTSWTNTLFGNNRGFIAYFNDDYSGIIKPGDIIDVTGIISNSTFELALKYANVENLGDATLNSAK